MSLKMLNVDETVVDETGVDELGCYRHCEMGSLLGVSCRQSHLYRRKYLRSLDGHMWKADTLVNQVTYPCHGGIGSLSGVHCR